MATEVLQSSSPAIEIGPPKIRHFLLLGLAVLLTSAHFLRSGAPALLMVALLCPLLLLSRKRWTLRAVQLLLLGAAAEWVVTGMSFVRARALTGSPYTRLAIIFSVVTLVMLAAAWVLQSKRVVQHFSLALESASVSTGAFALTAILLTFVKLKVSFPMLLIDRFLPGWGWLELVLLACYAAIVAEAMTQKKKRAKWRGRIWQLFSFVFFAQLLLGLAGAERFLQTGVLHLPVPALIVGGPIYRGEGYFMLVLFFSTVALVGPAWCSHLCYIGAWDHTMATRQKRPSEMPKWRRWGRFFALGLVALTALGLRLAGISGPVALGFAVVFGLTGIGLMGTWSRKRGVMTHCTTYCPIGLLATRAGKLNPFRIRIDKNTCTSCMACTKACRFDALSKSDVEKGKPGMACTLCGDCLPRCHSSALSYRFPGLQGPKANVLFIILIVSLHATFLAVARI